MTVLRRELKSVFGIMLNMTRKGRAKVNTYQLCLPTALLDLARSSLFFTSQRLPTVQRLLHQHNITKLTLPSSAQKLLCLSHGVKTYAKYTLPNAKYTLHNKIYKIVDFGGKGNCMFLAAAGSLSSILPNNSHDHKSLRHGVSKWYINHGQ